MNLKFLLLCVAILIPLTTSAQDRISGRNFATRSEVIARHGMAATSQPLATQVAIDILKQGGNAIDAAIAANATLGLMEPTGNGIGGDLFAIVWIQSEQRLYGLNASGRSPQSLTLEKLKKEIGSGQKDTRAGAITCFRSGLRRRLVRAPWQIRTIADERHFVACHRIRSRGVSSFGIDCVLLEP